MMRGSKRHVAIAAGLVLFAASVGCQDYTFVFQPRVDRQGEHLRFTVQQPSKADILFVIDNSPTMREEQEALKASIGQMLDFLAPLDTSYRIGVVSTDAFGWQQDCCGVDIPASGPGDLGRNRGDCDRCDCAGVDPDCVSDLFSPACDQTTVALACEQQMRRPHDGARGRLIGAYDPAVFDVNATDAFGNALFDVPPEHRDKLNNAFPTSAIDGPTGYAGQKGARWVIDRRAVGQEACDVCSCPVCGLSEDDTSGCFESCAKPVAKALVTAYFNANVNGLGTGGWGYEEGIKSALLTVGINPEDNDDQGALDPGSRLVRPGEPNSFATYPEGLDDPQPEDITIESWLRDDALLGIMMISDEEDCSVPSYVMDEIQFIEGTQGFPPGGFCYGEDRTAFLSLDRMSSLLTESKEIEGREGSGASRVVVGFIGGVENNGPNARRQGTAKDCVGSTVGVETQPSTSCSCLTGAEPGFETAWCDFTQDDSGTAPTCDALAGSRYVDFADQFRRRTYDSVCRQGQEAFGAALVDFARLATLACFELNDVAPADLKKILQLRAEGDEEATTGLLTVRRTARENAGLDEPPLVLPQLACDAGDLPEDGAWCYEPELNRICLLGIDRLLGDVYDIFVLTTDEEDFTQ